MSRKSRKTRRVLAGIVLIGFVTLLVYTIYLQLSDHPVTAPQGFRPLEEGFYSQGIDVSHHQGKVDWNKLFKSTDSLVVFVFCKATEGVSHLDTQWERNLQELRNRSVPVGAYHFFKPELSPKKQAQHFLKHYTPEQTDLPPVLDVEEEGTDDTKLLKNMKLWLSLVESKTGRRPIIYTNFYLFDEKFKLHFPEYNFWIANYSDDAERLEDPRILYWQYSDRGKIPGINGTVDLNMSKVKF